MKIIILDYVKNSGGGSTISDYILEEVEKDLNNEWLHLTSRTPSGNDKNKSNIDIPWIKKSRIHRIVFEKIVLKRIIRDYNPDLILSAQNLGVANYSKKQVLYVHQALPFTFNNLKIKLSYKDSLKMYVLKKLMIKHIKKADYIIVQTKYMKELIVKHNENIIISTPKIYTDKYNMHKSTENFIYPVNSQNYKRFDLVLKISRIFKKLNKQYKIYLTLQGNENKNISNLKKIVIDENLSILFIGKQTKKEIEELYKSCNLLFTSEVESLGLPILEAIYFNCKILALNTPVVQELTKNYKDVYLFNEINIESTVLKFIENIEKYKGGEFAETNCLLNDMKDNKIID